MNPEAVGRNVSQFRNEDLKQSRWMRPGHRLRFLSADQNLDLFGIGPECTNHNPAVKVMRAENRVWVAMLEAEEGVQFSASYSGRGE
jgi:hypothetical protein